MGMGDRDTGAAPARSPLPVLGCNSASKRGEVVGMSMAVPEPQDRDRKLWSHPKLECDTDSTAEAQDWEKDIPWPDG